MERSGVGHRWDGLWARAHRPLQPPRGLGRVVLNALCMSVSLYENV